MQTERGTIIVFVRAPVPGRVKTRLAPALSPQETVGLYRAFVADGLATVGRIGCPVTVAFTPAGAEAQLRAWLGEAYRYRHQRGTDLGRRMAASLAEAFTDGAGWALIVGSDLPDLPCGLLDEAAREAARTGAVLGPSNDGGYYLIGFRADRFTPAAFRGMDWGGAEVARRSLAALRDAGVAVHRLPPWRDVDTPEDLADLCRRLAQHPEDAPRTREWLRRAGRLAGSTIVKRHRLCLDGESIESTQRRPPRPQDREGT